MDETGEARGEPSGVVALRCAGLVKRYGEVVAVDGLDLEVRSGECFGLLGPNGAGKTTTVEVLEGLTPPTSGRVEVLGQRWGGRGDRALRERLGVQLQETQLADKLGVEETVRLFRSFYRRGREVAEVIELLDLGQKRRAAVHELSGGQRQRLALACALVSDPEVLFLDEPTTGLDPQARRRIWEVVEAFRGRGGTVLLTTHAMEEAARLCDRVAIMDRGRVIACDGPEALVASLGADQVVELRVEATVDEADLAGLPGVRSLTRRNGTFRLAVTRIGEALPALLAELERRSAPISSLSTSQATLEDLFIELTGRGLRDG